MAAVGSAGRFGSHCEGDDVNGGMGGERGL